MLVGPCSPVCVSRIVGGIPRTFSLYLDSCVWPNCSHPAFCKLCFNYLITAKGKLLIVFSISNYS